LLVRAHSIDRGTHRVPANAGAHGTNGDGALRAAP
jgi:hypothetical protein